MKNLGSVLIFYKYNYFFIKIYKIYFFNFFSNFRLQSLTYFNSIIFCILKILRNFGLIKSIINKSDYF